VPTPLAAEAARDLADQRWSHTRTAALDRYVEQVIKRATALTPEQRDRLAAALRAA